MNFFGGSPEKHERVSTLLPGQQPLMNQLQGAATAGNGGAFGQAADYYRRILDNSPEEFDAFAAPEMRRFQEQTIPQLGEQFAGMGSGALSSSGFQNASINAGTDLSERLAMIRANLRQGAASGLSSLANQGLQNFSQDVVTQPASEGLLSSVAPAIGNAIGSFAGPAGAAVGGVAGNLFKNAFGGSSGPRNTSPYGGASPAQASNGGKFNLPSFMQR